MHANFEKQKSPPAPLPPIFLINFNIEESPETLE